MLDDESEQELRRLLEYPSDTAGGLMTTEIAALPLGLTAGEAIERIRQLHEQYEDFSYVYVVDDDQKLRGVIFFRDLVFARPGASLDEVMIPDPVSVEAMTDRRRLPNWHRGIASSESPWSTSRDALSESSTPMPSSRQSRTRRPKTSPQRSGQVRGDGLHRRHQVVSIPSPVARSQSDPGHSRCLGDRATDEHHLERARARRPDANRGHPGRERWESESGGDDPFSGLRRRAPGAGDIDPASTGRSRSPQRLLAVAAAGVTYVLVDSRVFVSNSDPATVALVIGLACLANLLIATLSGSAIPLILRRIGLDPALASSILLTMITDAVGFGGFLWWRQLCFDCRPTSAIAQGRV